MAPLSLQVLGYGAAYPTLDRLTSSFYISIDNHGYLVDCGEGTQLLFSRYKIKRKNIKAICITHMHGDHCFGLMGLLSSLTNFQRKEPLILIGPAAIKEYVETIIRICQIRLSYEIEFIPLAQKTEGIVYEDTKLSIYTFPLKHRIETQGYRFNEIEKEPNLDSRAISKYNLTVPEILSIKRGDPVFKSGKEIDVSQYVSSNSAKSISICTDTIYDEDIIPYILNTDLLYHETTYLHEMKEQARERMHATTIEAATIANKAKVGKLLIGHFSSRYNAYEALLSEAKSVFESSFLSKEGLILEA